MQNWLQHSSPDISAKEMWPLNSPILTFWIIKFGEMLEVYYRYHPKPKIIAKLGEMLQVTAQLRAPWTKL